MPDDPHCFCYGNVALNPDKVFVVLVSTINKIPFLKIVEANDARRYLRIVSERRDDPRGIIEIFIKFLLIGSSEDHCTFIFQSRDDQWLIKNRPIMPTEVDRIKMVEGSLIQLLTSPVSWAESERWLDRERKKRELHGG